MHPRALSCLLLLAACASPPGGGEPGPDAGAGSATPDAAWGQVEISAVDFFDPSQPGAALPIEITDTTGAVIASAKTDATGEASVNVPAGATVTIAWPHEAHAETIAGVAAGDHLHVGAAHRVQGVAAATMTVAMPTPPAGTHVTVLGPCALDQSDADENGHATVTLRVGCAPYAIVAYAWDASQHEVAYLAATDVAPVDGGTISLVDAWKPMPELHVRAIGADVYNVERVSGPARFAIWRDLGKPDFEGVVAAPDVLPRADEVVSMWIDEHTVQIAIARPAGSTDQVIDVAPLLIPSITASSFDPATRTMWWTTSGGGRPDAISIELIDPSTWGSWYVLAPPDATSITLPSSGLFPAADAPSLAISLDETDVLADYAAARNLPSGGIDALLNADAFGHWARATY